MISFNTYAKYITSDGIVDDSPLGIYDSEFGDDLPTSVLLSEYSVPSCFSPDLFDMMDASLHIKEAISEDGSSDNNGGGDEEDSITTQSTESPRPPYRWVLIGPERSGTGMLL